LVSGITCCEKLCREGGASDALLALARPVKQVTGSVRADHVLVRATWASQEEGSSKTVAIFWFLLERCIGDDTKMSGRFVCRSLIAGETLRVFILGNTASHGHLGVRFNTEFTVLQLLGSTLEPLENLVEPDTVLDLWLSVVSL
jgi:hypothetical protein